MRLWNVDVELNMNASNVVTIEVEAMVNKNWITRSKLKLDMKKSFFYVEELL